MKKVQFLKKNSFYTTVASKLVEKLPKYVNKFVRQFVETFYQRKGVTPNSNLFSMVSEKKISKYLNNFNAYKATGLDGIPSRCARQYICYNMSSDAHH